MRYLSNLRYVEVFVAVAETGSMAGAAKRLGVTQAAISQNVRVIEESLDTVLFDRSVRPFRLTAAGQTLSSRARHLLNFASQTWEEVKGLGASSAPDLRLAVVNSFAGILLPDILDISEKSMGVRRFSMRSGLAFEQNEALLNREVDIVVTMDSMESVAGLIRYPLLREVFMLVGPTSMNLQPADLSALSRELPFLSYHPKNATGRLIDQHLRRLRIDLPRLAEFESSWSIGEMIRAGKGWAIMTPLCVLEAQLTPQDVVLHQFPLVPFTRTLWMLARHGELGNFPDKLAVITRQILKRRKINQISRYGNLATDSFTILTRIIHQ